MKAASSYCLCLKYSHTSCLFNKTDPYIACLTDVLPGYYIQALNIELQVKAYTQQSQDCLCMVILAAEIWH